MKEKITQFVKDNSYLIIAFFFIWIVPLILLVVLASESKSSVIAWKLWGTVVGVIIIIIYFARFKKWINRKVDFEKHEQLRVPVYLRLIQLCVSILSFVAVGLIISCMQEMFNEILTFVICCGCSVAFGYIFLIVDSYKRKPQKILREKE